MSFDAEIIARRFALREGCRFIGFKAVGIAVFSMNLRVLSLEAREVPAIEEFVLRLLREGVDSPASLSQLLGIESEIIHSRLVDLRRNELIDVFGSHMAEQGVKCVLTARGHEVAKSMKRDVMQEMTVPNVIFHGLLRRPVQIGLRARKRYFQPKEARESGLTLIRAIPLRPPHAEEIDVGQLDRVVKHGGRGRDIRQLRDIVAVKSVLKKVYTLYEPAVMLEFETSDSSRERQVAFAVEGQLSDEYEFRFAAARGPELLADIMTPRLEPLEQRLRKVVPERMIARLGRLDDVEDLAARMVVAEQEIEDAQTELKQEERADTRQVLENRIAELEAEKKKIEEERNARKVKHLWTPQIRKKLWEALETANEKILILSGFISSDVVNADFVAALRSALSRGVRIWIGYGFDKGNRGGEERRARRDWRAAEKSLASLEKEFPDTLVFRDVGRSHEKRLICDNRFTFGGSFNLLSFSGEHRGGGKVRHEGADLIEDSEFCEELYRRYFELFFRA